MSIGAAAIASAFGSERNSDCEILFCKHDVSIVSKRSVDEARRHTDSHAQPAQTNATSAEGSDATRTSNQQQGELLAEPLPAHLLVLSNASEVFDAQADRWSRSVKLPRAADMADVSDHPASRRLELRVLLSSAEEVPAARAAIKSAYTGQVEAGNVVEALEVRRQGSFLRMEGCSAACTEAIRGLLRGRSGHGGGSGGGTSGTGGGQGEVDAAVLLQLFDCWRLWPEEHEGDESFAALLVESKRLLVGHFRDAPAALTDPTLREQLLALPAAGLEALLESDDFGTDSESTVLLLLAAWMKQNHANTDAQTRQWLCRHVRLVQLSRPYLYHILPALAVDHTSSKELPVGWLPITPMEAAFIARCASAVTKEREQLLDSGKDVWDLTSGNYKFDPRRECLPPEGRTFHWHIDQDQLLKALRADSERDVCGTFTSDNQAVVAVGFDWGIYICVNRVQGSAGVFLYCDLPGEYKQEGSQLAQHSKLPIVVRIDATIAVHRWCNGARQDVMVRLLSGVDFVSMEAGRGCVDAMPLQPQQPQQPAGESNSGGAAAATDGSGESSLLLGPWSEYLQEGRISGTLSLCCRPRYELPRWRTAGTPTVRRILQGNGGGVRRAGPSSPLLPD